MKTLEEHFQEITAGKIPVDLYEPINYILSQGGKRIRPQLVMMSTELFGGDLKQAIYPAAAFEMLHNFTLIHDDIMDDAPIRRGKETVHKKWNSNVAILSGDALSALALVEILKTPCDNVLELASLIAQTSIEVCEGQQYDLNFETTNNVSVTDYIEMIRLKTAVMLAGCLKAGALLSGASEKDQELIYDFGINLGIAFQLRDDILDVYADTDVFGKVTGGDIKVNKKTYLYLKSLEDASPSQKEQLLHYFSSTAFDLDEKFKAVKDIYEAVGIKEKTEVLMTNYVDKALLNLDAVSIRKERKLDLEQLAIKLSNRSK